MTKQHIPEVDLEVRRAGLALAADVMDTTSRKASRRSALICLRCTEEVDIRRAVDGVVSGQS